MLCLEGTKQMTYTQATTFPTELYSTDDMGETVVVTESGLDNPEFEEFNPNWKEWEHCGDGIYIHEETITHDSKHFWSVEVATATPSTVTNEYILRDFDWFEAEQSTRWNNPEWINGCIAKYKSDYA